MKSVSIILVCYNQEQFVAEAIESVFEQSYGNIQLIIVDDCSTDNSQYVIREAIKGRPEIQFIANSENAGNCAAFNSGMVMATGEFIIDLAGDDVLLADRVSKQVAFFESLSDKYGVIYSNANYINEKGAFLGCHFSSRIVPPQGDIYKELISTYFIAPPTMMFRKQVIDDLGGYDEQLAYEDFDFWVRSARKYKYAYQPEVLTSIRKHSSSLSTGWYKKGDRQLYSTYLICLKIQQMNRSAEEDQALIRRLRYEIRQSVFSANHKEATLFLDLLKGYGRLPLIYLILELINRSKIDFRWLRNSYHWLQRHLFAPKSHFK
ncbi:glycosyltransferase [Imperialibacter roseus]|uniref:Glycosyltransferase n=1 Tax=Imperialibacter roseus TaxID=1324217 RepID=A0ABZ0IWX0_9BACT|nr:glycosyltransferase [Imperialibacter roseus]WOK08137.1 glycosyltransferase [Imperialibacter roseus]